MIFMQTNNYYKTNNNSCLLQLNMVILAIFESIYSYLVLINSLFVEASKYLDIVNGIQQKSYFIVSTCYMFLHRMCPDSCFVNFADYRLGDDLAVTSSSCVTKCKYCVVLYISFFEQCSWF